MKFEFFQVEITRKCSMHCTMCPSKLWRGKTGCEMDLEVFELLSDHFGEAKLVYLQGWGEPLEHENILEMARIVKGAGSEVGLTTNGMLLNEKTIKEILELNVDIIMVSMGGATKEVHESIRRGTSFDMIVKNIRRLAEEKKRLNMDKPRISLSLVMNTKNIHEIPDLVELAPRIGAEDVVATNLDYVFDSLTESLRVFSNKGDRDTRKYRKIIEQAKRVAVKGKISFRPCSLQMEEVMMCEANPLKGLVISCEGDLYPCIYLSLPFERIPRIFCGERLEVQRPYFGNIKDGFSNAWNSEEYRKFRGVYEKRLDAYHRAMERITFGSVGIKALDEIESLLSEHPLPEVCRSCYKAYGI